MNIDALLEADRRGILPPELKAALNEAKKRGLVQEKYDPTEGMSAWERLMAGLGKAFVDVGRGVGQKVGVVSREDIDEANRLDAPLMNTTSGVVGNVAGNIAAVTPLAMIPGVNTVVGSAGAGLLTGLAQPAGSNESIIKNTLTGGALGAAVPAGLAALKLGKAAVVDPFRKAGQEKIAGRVLQRFSSNADDVAYALDPPNPVRPGFSPGEIVAGSKPTLAEATMDPGLATLQQNLRTIDPATKSKLINAGQQQSQARLSALRNLAGMDEAGKPDRSLFFAADRASQAERSYGKAYRVGIKENRLTPKWQQKIEELAKNPWIEDARPNAVKLARAEGLDIADSMGSLEGMHFMRLALKDAIDKAPQTNIGGQQLRSMSRTLRELTDVMDRVSPDYRKARLLYAEQSKPIDQMKVADRLYKKSTNALMQGSEAEALYPNKFAQLLADEEGLVRAATGFKRNKGLEALMSPDQMSVIGGIKQDLQRGARARQIGLADGASPTAQFLVGRDILRQVAGPLGIPQSWSEAAISQNFLARPLTALARVPEAGVTGLLGDAMVDPAIARRLMAKAAKGIKLTKAEQKLLEAAEAATVAGPLGAIGLVPAE